MAKYMITSPEGDKYEVTAPDDATEDQVLEYAKSQFSGKSALQKDAEMSHKPSPGMKAVDEWIANFRKFSPVRQMQDEVFNRSGMDETRKGVSTLATALPKLGATAVDLTSFLPRQMYKERTGEESPMPELGPLVQKAQNAIAGQDVSKDSQAQASEALIQSLIFPGSKLANLLAATTMRKTDVELEDAGLPMWARLPLSMGAGLGINAATNAARTGLPNIDPRKALADRRIREAFDEIPRSELSEASRIQADAAGRGKFLMPSQALDRSYPELAALEREVRSSASKQSSVLRKLLADQQPQARDVSRAVVGQTSPYGTADEAAQIMQDSAARATGQITRVPNVLTQPLYEHAAQGTRGVAKKHIEGLLDYFGGLRAANKGNLELESRLGKLIDEVAERSNSTVLSNGRWKAGKQMSTSEAENLVKSIRGSLDDFSVQNPKVANLTRSVMDDALERINSAAGLAQPALSRARDVQRVLRPDYAVGKFDPLARATRGGGEAFNYLQRTVGSDKVDLPGFRRFIDRVHREDPNAIREAVGHHISVIRDQAFSKTASGFDDPFSGIAFANKLIGTDTKKQAFRYALEKAGEGRLGVSNPKAFAEGVIRMVDLSRNLSKPIGVDIGRSKISEINPADVGRIMLGQQIQSRAGMVNVAKAMWNRLSDDAIASMMTDPRSIELITAVGTAPAKDVVSKAMLAAMALQSEQQAAP